MIAQGKLDVTDLEHPMTEKSQSVDNVQASSHAAPQQNVIGQDCDRKDEVTVEILYPSQYGAKFRNMPGSVYRCHLTPEQQAAVATSFPEGLPLDTSKRGKTGLVDKIRAWTWSLFHPTSGFCTSSPRVTERSSVTVPHFSALAPELQPFAFILTATQVIACQSQSRPGRDNVHALLTQFCTLPHERVKMAGIVRWKTVKDLPSSSDVDGPQTRIDKPQLDYIRSSDAYNVEQHHIDAFRSLVATVFPGLNLVRTRWNA